MIEVSNDTKPGGNIVLEEIKSRIESKLEVQSYIQNLRDALSNGAHIEFQAHRRVDGL